MFDGAITWVWIIFFIYGVRNYFAGRRERRKGKTTGS